MVSSVIEMIIMLGGLFLSYCAFALATGLVHEAGHALAGLLCGFRIHSVKVGPIQFRLPNSWQWISDRKKYLSGFVQAQFRKVPGQWGKWQLFAFLLAGSLANFCVALLALPLAVQDTVSANLFAFFILVSALVGVG